MKENVYGVFGLIEWHALIPFNGGKVAVEFTDGSVTGFGVKPAVYKTSDEGVAAMIDSCEWYRNGRIVCLKRELKAPKAK